MVFAGFPFRLLRSLNCVCVGEGSNVLQRRGAKALSLQLSFRVIPCLSLWVLGWVPTALVAETSHLKDELTIYDTVNTYKVE